jgi:hypothetical protein
MKPFITIIVIIIILVGFFFIINSKPSTTDTSTYATSTNATSTESVTTEDYIRANISKLSPVQSSLGGTFYVTNIEAHGGAGTVKYEDGHMAYIADFTYDVDESGSTTIKTFTMRK